MFLCLQMAFPDDPSAPTRNIPDDLPLGGLWGKGDATKLGARQKGDSKWEKPVSAKICGFLRFPAAFCANLRLPNPWIYRASRKSAKIRKNLRKCAFRVRFLPFAVSLLARPEKQNQKNPRVRKIFRPRFWGRKWRRQFYGHPEKTHSFCRKTPCP